MAISLISPDAAHDIFVMNSPHKKTLTPKSAPVGLNQRAAQAKARPTAPPVYRPQPLPKVLQTKSINKPTLDAGITARGKHAVAPPVYRPQPLPKVLQCKTNAHGSQASNAPPFGYTAHRLESPKARQTTVQPGARPAAATNWNTRPNRIIQRSAHSVTQQNSTTVDTLCDYLNNKIGADNWAFTGGYALHLHGADRQFKDIDILVNSSKYEEAVFGLIGDVGFNGRVPSKITSKTELKKSDFKLDVLRAGTTFGTLDNIETKGNYRVVSTKVLKELKQKIQDDSDTEDDDKQKAINDIALIDKLNN